MELGDQAKIDRLEDREFTETSHLAIGAHPDDLEIMATHGVAQCLDSPKQWFTGVVVTDGAGSVPPTTDSSLADQEMIALRSKEQLAAAQLGKYLGVIQLRHPSSAVKKSNDQVVNQLAKIITDTQPEVIYTHNPLDKHLTHAGVFYQTLLALQQSGYQPKKFFGCEVWGSLDNLSPRRRVELPVQAEDQFVLDLIACHKSQAIDGKRFDRATLGRMHANASFSDSHEANAADKIWFAVDLMPFLITPDLAVGEFVDGCIDEHRSAIAGNFKKILKES